MSDVRLLATLTTDSSSGDVILDATADGVSVLSDPLTIDEGDKTSSGSASPAGYLGDDIPVGAEFSIDVTDEGTGAEGLKVWVSGIVTTTGETATPYFVTSLNTGSTSSGDHFNVDWPSGLAADDVAILKVLLGDYSDHDPVPVDINRPSGWSDMVLQSDETGLRIAVFWKRCTGAETGHQAVTLSGSFNGAQAGEISIWRDCVSLGDPFEALAVTSGNVSTMTADDTTTLGDNRRVVNEFITLGRAHSDPDTGWTEVYDEGDYSLGEIASGFAGSARAVTESGTLVAGDVRTRTGPPLGLTEWFAISYALVGGVAV